MIGKIEKFLKTIKEFVAGCNKNRYLMLGFGSKVAVLDRKRFGFTQGHADNMQWIKRAGNFYISPKFEPNPHIVISGMSGFGKSNLFKSLLLDIRNAGIPCIVFDAHNEHSGVVKSLNGKVHNAVYSGINILELDGATVAERISELTRLFKQTYSLGYIQTTKLSECLWYMYRKAGATARNDRLLQRSPKIQDLLDELSIFIRNARSIGEKNTLLHLKDRISLLNSSAFSGGLVYGIESITSSLHSFSLGGMKSKESQSIYISELLNRIYSRMHDSSKSHLPKLYVMIDEAQFLIDNSNDNPIIARLIEEGRKYGMGAIIVTHASSTLNKRIVANSATFVTFYSREPSETNYVIKVLSGGNADATDALRARLGTLKENQAIIVSGNHRAPTLVSTPKYEMAEEKGDTATKTNEDIERLKLLAKKPVLLEEVQRLGIDDGLLKELIDSRVMSRYYANGNGKTECWIMTYNRRLSVEHEVWVKGLSDRLNSAGIYNFTATYSGPDITAMLNGKRIAVEYETGSKSAGDTVKMINSRIRKYDATIVITNDRVFNDYCRLLLGSGVRVMPARDYGTLVDVLEKMAQSPRGRY